MKRDERGFLLFSHNCSACSLTLYRSEPTRFTRWLPEISTTSLNQVEGLSVESLTSQTTLLLRRRAKFQRRARVQFQRSHVHTFVTVLFTGALAPPCLWADKADVVPRRMLAPSVRRRFGVRRDSCFLTLTSCLFFIYFVWSIGRLH